MLPSYTNSLRRTTLGVSLLVGVGLLFGVATSQAKQQHKAKHSKRTHHTTPQKNTRRTQPFPAIHTVSGLEHYIDSTEEKYKAAHPNEKKEKHEERKGEEEEHGLDYLEAYLYRMQIRAFPNNSVDWSAYPRAAEQRNRMPRAHIGNAGSLGKVNPHGVSGNWQFVGPNKLDVPYRTYYGVDNLNGRTNAVAFAPNNPQTYYIGTAGGGVLKTTDGGATWNPLSDSWPLMQTSSLAIDPSNTNIIYAGTGDFDGWAGNGFGVMKSTDGGATWTNLGKSQLSGTSISDITIDPENPSIITVTQGRPPNWWGYVWRSTDAGATWTKVITDQAIYSDLSMGAKDNSGKRYLYAIGGLNPGSLIWRSADRGATWTKLTTPFSNSIYQGGVRIAASPTDPSTVYAISGDDNKIFKSTNAGNTWTNITGSFPGGYNWSQSEYDIRLTVSTQTVNGVTNDVVYVGLIDLVQSPDGGKTWRSIGNTYTNSAILHNDQHSMAINPNNPNEALVGCDGGVFYLIYKPDTNTWTIKGLNPIGSTTQFYRIAVHPTDSNILLGGTQDNASPYSNGNLTDWTNPGAGDGGFAAIIDSNTQFNTSQNLSIYMTTNGWASSSSVSPSVGSDSVGFIAPITTSPDGTTLYAGSNYLYSMNVSTKVWTARLGNKKLTTGVLLYIAVAPTNTSRIYTAGSDGQVWMTNDKGATWTQINTGTTALPVHSVTSIAVHPTNPNQILVTLGGSNTSHVYLCSDTTAGATRTWTNVSGVAGSATGLPDIAHHTIVYDPDAPDTTWYTGSDVGAFVTTDGGKNWSNATNPLGLPNVEVSDLKVVPGHYLVAGTFGRGMWRISLGSAVTPSLTLSPTTVVGGKTAKGTISIPTAAGTGGTVINLSSSNTSAATVPATVTIPAGATTAIFTIQTLGVASYTSVNISANTSSATSKVSLWVVPAAPLAVKFAPPTVPGGTSAPGTVQLNGVAPAGGLVVNLSSSDPSVTVPATITVAKGASTATFTAATNPVATTANVTVSATGGGGSADGNLQVVPSSPLTLTLTPISVVGGATAKGKVTLSGNAPTGDVVVSLATDSANATVPMSVTILAGSSSATFSITTVGVSTPTNVNISASANNTSAQGTLTLQPVIPVSVIFTPTSVAGGSTAKVAVVLSAVAPAGGAVVTLTSGDGSVSVPMTVTVAAGSNKGSFIATTTAVGSTINVPVTASLNGASVTGALQVRKSGDTATVLPTTLALSPKQVTGGINATGTITLSGNAPVGGITVALSSNSANATVPANVTIAEGSSSATFGIVTTPVATDTAISISASAQGVTVNNTLTVLAPRPASLAVKPTVVVGGSAAKATVTFTGAIPAGGLPMTVQIGKDTQTINVAQASTTATFNVPTPSVPETSPLQVSATLSGSTATATISLVPSGGFSLGFNPTAVTGGNKATGTITLVGKAPVGGLTFSLSSADTATATVPATVTVLEGATTANFTIKTLSATADKYVKITATQGGMVAGGSLLVTTAKVASVTFDSSTVQGGSGLNGTVTLDANAPAGGITVQLSSSNGAVTVPASVTIAKGSKTATFTITTSLVGFNTAVQVTATANSSSAMGTLTLTP